MAACEDPRNFTGQDLVKELQGKMRKYPVVGFNHPYPYYLAVIALCTAGANVGDIHVNKMLNAVNDSIHGVDTLSLGVVATACVYQKQKQKNSTVTAILQTAVKALKAIQEKKGGNKYGNEISTVHGAMVRSTNV